jgi:hypothetical protein
MTMSAITTENYCRVARQAMGDKTLQRALYDFQQRLGPQAKYRELPEGPGLRRRAHGPRKVHIIVID